MYTYVHMLYVYIHTYIHVQRVPTQLVWQRRGGWARVCRDVLGRLLRNTHAWPFEEPVDVQGLQLADYHSVVKRPMDLGVCQCDVLVM